MFYDCGYKDKQFFGNKQGLGVFSYGRGKILNALCHLVAQGCHSVVLLCSGTNVAFYKASKVLRNNKNNV